ncbi:hypothetical protein Tco_0087728 [Tanacetum coccineum]
MANQEQNPPQQEQLFVAAKQSLLPPNVEIINGTRLSSIRDIIIKLNKRHREKVVPYTRFLSLLMMHKMKEGYGDSKVTSYHTQVFNVNNWSQKPNQPKEPLFTDHMLAICNAAEPMTSTSTPVVAEMHKEDQQATGGPTSLEVTKSFIIHFECASGNDASAVSTAKADLGKSAPSDFVPQQQGMNEGTKNTSYDHLFAGTDPHVLTDKTKSVSEGSSKTGVKCSANFKDLDSPEDDPIIVVDDSDEDEEADEVHATTNSQKHKLELEKNKAEAEAALLKAQPFFPNVGQLNELLVKSLQTEFLKILSAHDFSSSLPTELKELPSKFNELTEEVKGLK